MRALSRPQGREWLEPERFWPGLDTATAELDPPFGVISWPALARNAFDLLDRSGGKPIRVASKSVRVRGVLDAVLAVPGFAGVLAYTLPEALWLAETVTDVLVGYPTVHRDALRRLCTDPELASRVTLMVDSVAHLDAIDALVPPPRREELRVCLELDVSYEAPILGRIGVWRSPVRTPEQARALAEDIVRRAGFRLVGLMAYEAQIAGVGDRPRGRPVRAAVLRSVQRRSMRELVARRAETVAEVGKVAQLQFVNGGGTGSIERTAADESVTEIAAGSGLFGPHLFDAYSSFTPAPAAAFALPVVRKPTPDRATLLGGGWVASGPHGADRPPQIEWPPGLRFTGREGAGEVQSPVEGAAARELEVGDRVWLRHAKAGELSEHLDSFAVVDRGEVLHELPTYRGEGKAFL